MTTSPTYRATPPADHPQVPLGGVGVLLVNLGTPDAPTPRAVRRYLKEFLWDRRVVEIPRALWWLILNGVVLNTRPRKSAKAYAEVWTAQGSPLAVYTRGQALALQTRLGPQFQVAWAMRYGQPAIADELARLCKQGCDRILIAPLYPQYSGATTASVYDAVHAFLAKQRWMPALRMLPPYYRDALHIKALAEDLAWQLSGLDFVPELLLLSFHGMPVQTLTDGDPYHCQCQVTARLVAAELAKSYPEVRIAVSFQSRFGRAKWLQPATDAVIAEAAADGTRRMAIATPGFSADCLETREELAIRGRDQFQAAGGENFAVLDCLNDRDAGMEMLEALVRRELMGWV